jgi:hypothetical protein
LESALQPWKLQKASTLQLITGAGICLTHKNNVPPPKTDITLIQNNISKTENYYTQVQELRSKIADLPQDMVIDVLDNFIKTAKVLELQPVE